MVAKFRKRDSGGRSDGRPTGEIDGRGVDLGDSGGFRILERAVVRQRLVVKKPQSARIQARRALNDAIGYRDDPGVD